MSFGPGCGLLRTHLIHASNVRIIGRGIVLHRDKYAVTLGCSDVNQVCFRRLGVDAVNFHNPHSVAFKPEVLTSKSAHVDDAEHISLSRFHGRFEIVGIIHEGSFWYWLGPRWVGHTDETLHELRHLLMIPIGQSQYPLLIVLPFVGGVGISNNQWSTKTIRILSDLM